MLFYIWKKDLKGERVVWFKVFDTDKWPLDSASLKLFGNKEIKNLLNYYKDHNYLSEECANTAEREWPAFKIGSSQLKICTPHIFHLTMYRKV